MSIIKTDLNASRLAPSHPTTYWSACPCMMRFGPVPDSDPVPPMLAAYATHRDIPLHILM